MTYRSLRACVADLERAGHLVRIDDEIDPRLEAAEIQRRVYRSGGPAVLFTNVKGCRFPMVSNLFGTLERSRFLFRDTLDAVRRLIELKVDPANLLRRPTRYWRAPWTAWKMLPRRVSSGPILAHTTTIRELPQVVSWPRDGGPFITLPQVYTEHVDRPGLMQSNLGMYRIQLAGNRYEPDREIGLHYQLHRGIGVHQSAAQRRGEPFRANIFVGGHPAMTLAAVMPLPEGLSELTFAGALAGHRIPMVVPRGGGLPFYADADFCITGTVEAGRLAPEGPFGDHLGYYSLEHEFPVLRVERVYHREGAIWPFTVVGRPPQEDTSFGELIHELTGDVIPTVLPGVRAVHAVDAAGVHPLLLAIGSERYLPFQSTTQPAELLTQANAILGQGQLSLAKYLLIVNHADDPDLQIHDLGAFFRHVLQRIDWKRDLHFQTCTTVDTLDYSGSSWNEGSKVVWAAVGPPRRELATHAPSDLTLPDGWRDPRVVMPGVLAIQAALSAAERGVEPSFAPRLRPVAERGPDRNADRNMDRNNNRSDDAADRFCAAFVDSEAIRGFPLVVLVDDSEFVARTLGNFLWVVFTRSDPAADLYGIGAYVQRKHWGCQGSLVIDARIKAHHAPPLVEDPVVTQRVDALAARGGPLARWL